VPGTRDAAGRGDHGWVLHDVDRSLRALLCRCLPDGTAVEFGRPPEFEPETLLLNGFLYDVREDVSSLAGYADDIRALDGSDGSTVPAAQAGAAPVRASSRAPLGA
jgi:hypothetical protein